MLKQRMRRLAARLGKLWKTWKERPLLRKRVGKSAMYAGGYILVIYIVLQLAACVSPGYTIVEIIREYRQRADSNMLFFHWNGTYSAQALLYGSLSYTLFVLYEITKKKTFRPGEEYGNARFMEPEQINRQYQDKNPYANRIYSHHLRISMDGRFTGINNNCLVIGGSGAGKSFLLLMPNLFMANAESVYPGSFVITDPKGDLLRATGSYLVSKGYRVKVLNLTAGGMEHSDGYNPFDYIRTQDDIPRLLTNLFANTRDKKAPKGDPFWEKAEMMFLESLFILVWMDGDLMELPKNLNTVIDLLGMAEVDPEDEEGSPLTKLFKDLVEKTKDRPNGGENHPAWIKYKKTVGAAADTVRSIIIAANARMSIFENEQVRRILASDGLDLPSIGTTEKTALFCVIPDADTTYNCIAGMLYTQLFQELYGVAGTAENSGKLPIPVTFYLDEFANIALPDDFMKLLATMRSRLISAVIIIQNLAQIKEIYEKSWENITGNCDITVYLGGNEASTHKYISESIGKTTIWKRSYGRNFGRNGSNSRNEDVVGADLMTPDRVRTLSNDKCIVFVRGKWAVIDDKFHTLKSPEFAASKALGDYIHIPGAKTDRGLKVISEEEFERMKRQGKTAELTITWEDIKKATGGEPITAEQLDEIIRTQRAPKDVPDIEWYEPTIDITDLTVEEVLGIPGFELDEEELAEVLEGIRSGLSDEDIKGYMMQENAQRMRITRLTITALRERQKKEEIHGQQYEG